MDMASVCVSRERLFGSANMGSGPDRALLSICLLGRHVDKHQHTVIDTSHTCTNINTSNNKFTCKYLLFWQALVYVSVFMTERKSFAHTKDVSININTPAVLGA